MSIDIDTIEPRRCPICDAGVLSKLDSPTGLSHFIKFVCGFEMCDQYEARPRGWKPRLGSTCRNIDANSLWALRRAVEQSAEDFNAEAVARLKAEAEVRELRAALEYIQPGHKCGGDPVCIVCALRAETDNLRAALERARARWARWRDMVCLYDVLVTVGGGAFSSIRGPGWSRACRCSL